MKRIFGLAAIIAGGVLALFFPDLEFGWFRGRPLGIALVVIGGIELLESTRRRKPKGLVEELRDDLGLGARNRDGGEDRDEDRGGSRGRDRERDRDREMVREFDQEVEREARKHRGHPDL
ncbi:MULTISPECIES: hypothetical protein [unclassified Streptomyces]|uniref:hypothetical protein n=1 Tax=unclassified Streptomyces TaxID=2593676 RepID=UPI0019D5253C|nr:hypothetical protein [Streptomyces sp. CB02980]MCB8902651.1 hypothetical protein [Streptomyces sp. CB02980]